MNNFSILDIISIKLLLTSGAIQAALPLLLVMYVALSAAVPKSHIFSLCPPPTNNRLGGFKSLCISGFGFIECRYATPCNVTLF